MTKLNPIREAELALLNAPFEDGGWARAIDLVARSTGGAGANLVAFGGPLPLSLNLFAGRDASLAERYFARSELWGPCNWRVNSAADPLTVQYERHYNAYRQVADTAAYDDAVSDLDMQFGCQSVLISDARTFVGLAVYRGRREGPCDAEALDEFERLVRPLQRALRLQLALSGEAAELIVGDIGKLESALVLIDRHGCVSALTPAAEALAEPEGPVRLSGSLFELSDRDENRRMQAALARLLVDDGDVGASWIHEMRIGRRADKTGRGWIARAFRLPQRDHGLGFDPHVAIAFEPLEDRTAMAA